MKLLLDTHIWLWSLLDPGKLKPRLTAALDNPENERWLSPISVWELSILVQKRRVVLNVDIDDWIADAMIKAPVKEAPITYEVALETRRIRLPYKDPADRFIAAAAKVFQLTLVTADARLLKLAKQGISVFPNR